MFDPFDLSMKKRCVIKSICIIMLNSRPNSQRDNYSLLFRTINLQHTHWFWSMQVMHNAILTVIPSMTMFASARTIRQGSCSVCNARYILYSSTIIIQLTSTCTHIYIVMDSTFQLLCNSNVGFNLAMHIIIITWTITI